MKIDLSREVANCWYVTGSFINRRLAGHIGVHNSVIDRLLQHLQATGMVDERLWSGRPRKTTYREDRLISWCNRRNSFATTASIHDELNFGGHVSVRTVNIQLNEQCQHTRQLINRPQLSLRHWQARRNWSHDHLYWNILNWKRVHWSVDFYYTQWMDAFESGCIETLHFTMGT